MNSVKMRKKVSELKLVVFDCDGTLVDSQDAIFQSMSRAFKKYGLPNLSRASVRRIVGLSLPTAISLLLPEVDSVLVKKLHYAYSDEWQRMRTSGNLEEPLFPGALEAINAAQEAGWLLGVATGKSYKGLIETLSYYEILDKFCTLQTSDKVKLVKPNPEMIFAALSETSIDKSNAVMIGDTTFDIDMAMNAGIRSIGVNWGYHGATELMECGALCVINEFHELQSALNKVVKIYD